MSVLDMPSQTRSGRTYGRQMAALVKDAPEQPAEFGPLPAMWSCVTKPISPGSPEARSPEAAAAIQKEYENMKKHRVWDDAIPEEWADVKARESDARVVGARCILAIKNHESPEPADHVYKARVVAGGHRVKDTHERLCRDREVHPAPVSRVASRTTILHSCLQPGRVLHSADVEAAYLKTPLLGPPC